MAIALTGKLYPEIPDGQYVSNLLSQQVAYQTAFGVSPFTVGCIELDAGGRERVLNMFDGVRILRTKRSVSQTENIRAFSGKVRCLLDALANEVPHDTFVLWSRMDAFVEVLRLPANKSSAHLYAFRNPIAAGRLCDNVVVASVSTYEKVGLHRGGKWYPEQRIEAACNHSVVCSTFQEHKVFVTKPSRSRGYLHSRGTRLWDGTTHSYHVKPPKAKPVTFRQFAACVTGEFRTFPQVAPHLSSLLRAVNSTTFVCLRNATPSQVREVESTLYNAKRVATLPYTANAPERCGWHKFRRIHPIWEGISCAYKLMLRYEISNAVKFEYMIRLRTDGTYDEASIELNGRTNSVHGLAYSRFLPERLLCDHFYVAPRHLSLGAFHNDYPLSVCDRLRMKGPCGRLPMRDTECFLKRRVELWGGRIDVLRHPTTVLIKRPSGMGPVCGAS